MAKIYAYIMYLSEGMKREKQGDKTFIRRLLASMKRAEPCKKTPVEADDEPFSMAIMFVLLAEKQTDIVAPAFAKQR
jgi:hypothetical protein